ncbi:MULTISPECIES: PIG-L deacetylase family protein [Actinotignum]|uniref:PIG-L deacetylase family protein n=1 Tax=Actinotignum TaxID=1653174 RepID=UPI00254C20DF|nr:MULTISPECIES: PIG-L family deacetylase [Actinotignum]MDE1536890.1 PIG-L family deacetylase [Actinotignum schaalii]MDK7271221.1 PIG-L family deacetylase [Actinotignum schaalii]MDY5144074.1 PIG-L family deacetylase [Actinotignum timonense]
MSTAGGTNAHTDARTNARTSSQASAGTSAIHYTWDPADPLFARTLFLHAHPDDEAIQAGGLTALLTAAGHRVSILTCTRGEEGEAVPGTLSAGAGEAELVARREAEITRARAILGVTDGFWLGTAPALASGAAPRRYRDSGMAWIAPGVAGPAPSAGPNAFSRADLSEEIADARALLAHVRPTVIIGYDAAASYGHPDHVRVHHLARALGRVSGIPVLELASTPGQAGWCYRNARAHEATVVAALRCYSSQLTVVDRADPALAGLPVIGAPKRATMSPDSEPAPQLLIRHVGGQLQELPLWPGLRPADDASSFPVSDSSAWAASMPQPSTPVAE